MTPDDWSEGMSENERLKFENADLKRFAAEAAHQNRNTLQLLRALQAENARLRAAFDLLAVGIIGISNVYIRGDVSGYNIAPDLADYEIASAMWKKLRLAMDDSRVQEFSSRPNGPLPVSDNAGGKMREEVVKLRAVVEAAREMRKMLDPWDDNTNSLMLEEFDEALAALSTPSL